MRTSPHDPAASMSLSIRQSLLRKLEAHFEVERRAGRMKSHTLARSLVEFLGDSLTMLETTKKTRLEDQLRQANDELNKMRAKEGLAPLVYGEAPMGWAPPAPPVAYSPAPAYSPPAPPYVAAPPAYATPPAPPQKVWQSQRANLTERPELCSNFSFSQRTDPEAWAPFGTPPEEMHLWELSVANLRSNPKLRESQDYMLKLLASFEADVLAIEPPPKEVLDKVLRSNAPAVHSPLVVVDEPTDEDRRRLQEAFDNDPASKTLPKPPY